VESGKGYTANMADKPICFVISPIGEVGGDIRKRSDLLLKYIIMPAADGFEVIRADQISEPGDITSQVIDHLLNDPIVVADLTGHNANVFYELAVRHLLRKPYVQLIQKKEKPPFDTVGIRTIPYELTDLDNVEEAREAVRKQIAFTTANPDKVTSPMSASIDLSTLSRSDDPAKQEIASLLQSIQDLGTILRELSKNQTTFSKSQLVLTNKIARLDHTISAISGRDTPTVTRRNTGRISELGTAASILQPPSPPIDKNAPADLDSDLRYPPPPIDVQGG
jgi:hypothetical protein